MGEQKRPRVEGCQLKITIDTERCSGHGRCYTMAPEVFDSDENGNGFVRSADTPEELRAKAIIGVENCPERAISVEG